MKQLENGVVLHLGEYKNRKVLMRDFGVNGWVYNVDSLGSCADGKTLDEVVLEIEKDIDWMEENGIKS